MLCCMPRTISDLLLITRENMCSSMYDKMKKEQSEKKGDRGRKKDR